MIQRLVEQKKLFSPRSVEADTGQWMCCDNNDNHDNTNDILDDDDDDKDS